MSRCPGHFRHWFTETVGLRRPDCVRCGAPNPKKLTDSQREAFDYWVEHGWCKPEGWTRK